MLHPWRATSNHVRAGGFVLPAESLFPSGLITDPTAGNQAGIYFSTPKLNSPTTQSILALTRKVKPKYAL